MQDKRTEARNPCYLRADIILGSKEPPIAAEAHDISDLGMRLVVADATALPNEFIVSIPRRHIREAVKVVRRDETSLGVQVQGVKRAAL
jgi:hypothetical protein